MRSRKTPPAVVVHASAEHGRNRRVRLPQRQQRIVRKEDRLHLERPGLLDFRHAQFNNVDAQLHPQHQFHVNLGKCESVLGESAPSCWTVLARLRLAVQLDHRSRCSLAFKRGAQHFITG